MTNIKDIRKEIEEIFNYQLELFASKNKREEISVVGYRRETKHNIKKIVKLFSKHTSKILDMVTLEEKKDLMAKNLRKGTYRRGDDEYRQGYNQAVRTLNKKKETIKQQCLKEEI